MDTAALPLPRSGRARRGVSLERFSAATSGARGVRLSDLTALDQLAIRTRNSTYSITVLSPRDSRILVKGGAFFPVTCEAHLNGGSVGGSLLKLDWIGCGFCLEILHAGRRIVTSDVQSITIDTRGHRAG